MPDTFGVSAQDVLDTLPADTSNVTLTSSGLNTEQVESFIERGGGVVAATLERHGIAPAALTGNGLELAREAVIAYAAERALERIGGSSEQINRRRDEWNQLLKELRSTPQNLGVAQDAPTAQKVRSNIDTSCKRSGERRRWNNGNYSGW